MIQIMEFDFQKRTDRLVRPEELKAAGRAEPGRGVFYWIDADAGDQAGCQELAAALGVPEPAREQVFGPDCEGRYDVYDQCLHFALTEARLTGPRLETTPVDVVLAETFMLTYHRQEAEFLKQIRRTCREDFRKFAKSPGFLVYELGDHLIDVYRKTLQALSNQVEKTQLRLFGAADDEIFLQVSELTSDLLSFRKVAMASRELMHELGSRRSPFISETTQPFLENMAGTLERLSADVVSEREVLAETLNLYMGMVSHRTNRVVNRLTVISMVFLPLTFLCGVYGMNFEHMPELHYEWGYYLFWATALALGGSLLYMMRKQKWI